MTVSDLLLELAHHDPDDPVEVGIVLEAAGWDASYLQSALEMLDRIGGMFGAPLEPEVEVVLADLRRL